MTALDRMVAGMVKPLEFADDVSETPFGEYVVQYEDEETGWGMWSPTEGDGDYPRSLHDTEDDAKSAAQADYTARILAAVPMLAEVIGALDREKSLIWIIENTTQVRVRDLAIDMLEQIRAILAKL